MSALQIKQKCHITALLLCVLIGAASAAPKAIRVDDFLPQRGLAKVSAEAATQAIQAAAAQLEAGDALILPMQNRFGTVRLADLPDDIQLIGGQGEKILVQGLMKGATVFGADYSLDALSSGAQLADNIIIYTQGSLDLGNTENTYWIDHIGSIKVDGAMQNCTGVWMRYNHEKSKTETPSFHFNLHNSGDGVRMLQFIEHNQENQRPAVKIENARNMVLLNGSTESGGGSPNPATSIMYQLLNCTNVHLGHRRFFHRQKRTGWGKYAPVMSLKVTGSGNIIDNVVDIANPQSISLLCTDPKVQLWSTIFEESANFSGADPERFMFSHVSNAMPQKDMWNEPRIIDNETVMAYETDAGKVDLTSGESLPSGVCLPSPPRLAPCDIPTELDLLYKKAAGFGAEAIAAGADPTGRKSSDAAFAKVLSEKNILEIGPGTYRLEEPLVLGAIALNKSAAFMGRKAWIIGAGPQVTRIVYNGPGAAITTGGDALNKAGAAQEAEYLLSDLAITGGDYGFEISSTQFNVVKQNVSYSGYNIAGVYIHSGASEQNRWINCSFDGGEYGFRYDGYSDKYLLYGCTFQNHSKGGVYCTNIVHWHSGIYQCIFKNITGPAISITGGNTSAGYGPWVFTTDNCIFEECGSATEPVVEYGVSWLGVLSNSRIVTQSRPVYAGFKGCFGIIDNVQMNLNMTDNTAMYLGHQRWEKTAGVGGSRVTNVTANGDIKFLDFDTYVRNYENGNYYNATLYQGKPWAFTYLFYNVNSTNIAEQYALYKDGQRAVDLSGYAQCEPTGIKPRDHGNGMAPVNLQRLTGPKYLYDIRGRKIGVLRQGNMPNFDTGSGVYLEKIQNVKVMRKLHM